MPDYQLGKIYKIVGNGKIYVGSTTRPLLCQRLTDHRSKYNMWKKGTYHKLTSFECIEDPDCYIEILEVCPCSSIDELLKCEGKWIRELDCVNKCISGRTKKEYHNDNKEKIKEQNASNREYLTQQHNEYVQQNKEKIKEINKKSYEKRKEKIKEYKQNYQQENKEQISQKRKEYYERNRDKLIQKMKENYEKNKEQRQQQAIDYRIQQKLIKSH